MNEEETKRMFKMIELSLKAQQVLIRKTSLNLQSYPGRSIIIDKQITEILLAQKTKDSKKGSAE